MTGYLTPEGRGLWLEGNGPERISELVAWFRGRAPSGEEVIVTREPYEELHPVAHGASPLDVACLLFTQALPPTTTHPPIWADGMRVEDGFLGELTQWYLGLVPPGRRMMLADECVARVVPLTPGMGAAEIARAFDGEWAAPPWAG